MEDGLVWLHIAISYKQKLHLTEDLVHVTFMKQDCLKTGKFFQRMKAGL